MDMESAQTELSALQRSLSETLTSIIDYAPSFLAALLVLFIGWLIARMVRSAARRLFGTINRLLDRFFQKGRLSSARLPSGAAALLGEISFWVILFLAVTIAARIAGLPAVSTWLNQIVVFLPNLLIGALIIVVGYFVGLVAGEQVEQTATAANSTQSVLIGRLAGGAVFVTGTIIGLDQMGVNVTFLVALFAALVGAIFVGFSIAFGLGARDYVSNLIGARTARQKLDAGSLVRVGGTEGKILEITQTQIALDTEEGRVLVPARLTEETGVLIVSRDRAGETQDE